MIAGSSASNFEIPVFFISYMIINGAARHELCHSLADCYSMWVSKSNSSTLKCADLGAETSGYTGSTVPRGVKLT